MTSNEIAVYYENEMLGSFSAKLMELIGNADEVNKIKLSIAYPEYTEAYKLWFHKPDGWNTIKPNKDKS